LLRRVKRPTGVGVTNALASPQYISNLQSGCIEEYVKVVASPRISLFVARGNAPKPFHLTTEIFDEMTPCVFVLVMRGMPAGSLAKRDDSLNASTRQAVAQPMCVERLVADEGQAIDAGHKSIEACDVVAIARQRNCRARLRRPRSSSSDRRAICQWPVFESPFCAGVVKAFPSDRADKPLRASILLGWPCGGRSIPYAHGPKTS
jgi:hypothetical protein